MQDSIVILHQSRRLCLEILGVHRNQPYNGPFGLIVKVTRHRIGQIIGIIVYVLHHQNQICVRGVLLIFLRHGEGLITRGVLDGRQNPLSEHLNVLLQFTDDFGKDEVSDYVFLLSTPLESLHIDLDLHLVPARGRIVFESSGGLGMGVRSDILESRCLGG